MIYKYSVLESYDVPEFVYFNQFYEDFKIIAAKFFQKNKEKLFVKFQKIFFLVLVFKF